MAKITVTHVERIIVIFCLNQIKCARKCKIEFGFEWISAYLKCDLIVRVILDVGVLEILKDTHFSVANK